MYIAAASKDATDDRMRKEAEWAAKAGSSRSARCLSQTLLNSPVQCTTRRSHRSSRSTTRTGWLSSMPACRSVLVPLKLAPTDALWQLLDTYAKFERDPEATPLGTVRIMAAVTALVGAAHLAREETANVRRRQR